MSSNKLVSKDGLAYSEREVFTLDANKKKVSVGFATVPEPTTATLQSYIDAGIFTMADVVREFIKGYAVTLQAQVRKPSTGTNTIAAVKQDMAYVLAAVAKLGITRDVLEQAKSESPNDVAGWLKEYIENADES